MEGNCQAANSMPSLLDIRNISSRMNGRPTDIITCFRGEVDLSRLNHFRIRLLLHCASLNQDTAVFHQRVNRNRDPICSLCKTNPEDALHLIIDCPALQQIRYIWFPQLLSFLPLNMSTPRDLYDHMMGATWLHNHSFQRNLVQFLTALRSERQSLLLALPLAPV